jgi:hypothetical protein
MAVTQEQSDQIENQEATPPVMTGVDTLRGKLKILRFTFTQGAAAGDAGSLAELVKVPAGVVRVFLASSRITCSALGAARTMDIGWLAYVDTDGDAVAADPNGLDDGVDVSLAVTFNPTGTIGEDETKLFESNGGVTLTAQVNDATLIASATINGYFVYVQD